MIDYEEYEKLPTQDQWMAHATMPATVLLGLWKRRFEKLVWMALYNPRGAAGTAQWYCSVTSREEEEDMLASDDDYEPKGDGDEDAEEDGTESDGEGGIESEDGRILDEEVDTLMEDAYGEEAHQKRVELQSQESCADDKPTEIPHSEPTDLRPSRLINLERKTKVSSSLHNNQTVSYMIEGYKA